MAVTWVLGNGGYDGFDAIAGEDISAGELVTVDYADDLAYLACAASGSENLPAMGMATEDVSSGDWGHFKFFGQVRGLPTNVDGYAYVSNTPGAFSATAGDTSQRVAKYTQTDADSLMGMLEFEYEAHNHPVSS